MSGLWSKLGKQFKIKHTKEIWKLSSFKPGVIDLYTIDSVVSDDHPIQLTLEVTNDDLQIEFATGRFEWVTTDSIELKEQCRHNYKKYIGFTETYMYCDKCNEKEKS